VSGLAALDGDEQLLAEALERFCASERVSERAQHGQGKHDPALWRALCEQGYLELARPESASLRMVVVMVEVLGRHGMPGPLTDTLLALGLVDDAQAAPLLSGGGLAAIAAPPFVPQAGSATLVLEIEQDRVFQLEARGAPNLRAGLGAEDWAEQPLARSTRFEGAASALLAHDVALAAQLAALADGLVRRTAEHAATRKQFGKPLSAFQAVSHPLASAHISLAAASMLARAAACATDDGAVARARSLATAALISAERAALEAVYTCHQKLGALGITLEGPAHHVSRRVRSLATRAAARSEATREALLESAGVHP
jgi:acyl-CoA dehydrogenase